MPTACPLADGMQCNEYVYLCRPRGMSDDLISKESNGNGSELSRVAAGFEKIYATELAFSRVHD